MKTKRLWFMKIASMLLLVMFMSSCKDEDVGVDGVCPIVVSTDPANMALNVPLDQQITVTFNVPMNPLTITQASFTVQQEPSQALKTLDVNPKITPNLSLLAPKSDETSRKNVPPKNPRSESISLDVIGNITIDGNTATFSPVEELTVGANYTCRIVSSIKDLKGNYLQVDYVWTFSTGSLNPPTVVITYPNNTAINVALNTVLSAEFSEVMEHSTINQSTFLLKRWTVPVPGTVSYSGTTATFTPADDLLVDETYVATITVGATNLAGTPLQSDFNWTFSTGALLAPTVISVDPLNLAVNVPLNKVIRANFSIGMNPSSINSTTFILKDGLNIIPSEVSYSGTTAMLTPLSDLISEKTYVALITSDVENEAGTNLVDDYFWTFSTGPFVAPTVLSTEPYNLETEVELNRVIKAVFSIPMNASTFNTSTFTLRDGTTPISGAVNFSGATATFTPASNLPQGRSLTATIDAGVENETGSSLGENYVWSFTTLVLPAPTVISTDPPNLATNVPLDKVISANFSEGMNPTTITTSTFILMDGATPIVGVVNNTGTTATFTPSSNLPAGKTFIATITTDAQNVAGTALENNYVWSFSTGAATAPTVVSVDPFDGAIDVALDKVLSASFSVAMDPLTINNSTFTLMDGATPIVGTVNYSVTTARATPSSNMHKGKAFNSRFTPSSNLKGGKSFTATFTPTSNLELGKTYTATITTGAQNIEGTALEDNYEWYFSTGTAVAPTVVSVEPLNGAINVEFDKVLSAIFSVAMDPLTITTSTFKLMDGVTPVVGTVDYFGTTATFTPLNDLPAGKTFTATITTGAENEAGSPLATDYDWSFTTQYSLTVIAVNGTVLIDPDQLAYNFGDIVELAASANSGFTFDSWSGDATGNANPLSVVMNANKVITANFSENPPLGPGIIDLGTSGDFAILTKTGISTINSTLITGHIGVSPESATAITGFSETMDASGEFSTSIYVVGRIYAADYAPPTPTYVSTAISDQETAFTTAMGLTTDVINDLGAGDISGMTLAPGLYKWSTGLLITNQGVTLSGGPNDTWVFQIADDFTIENDAAITLTGGALFKNIFWITSTQALLGSNVVFNGNILAQTLISLTNGTTVYGRLLSQTAVTLDASIVTKPVSKK